jgi:hypothetical protein
MRETAPLVLIGNSSENRFPAFSYSAYTKASKPFYCLDMGGRTRSRGPTKGGTVYTSVADLPADRGDLAVIWVKPNTSKAAVDLAHEAGCKRVWFSFHTAKPETIEHAKSLGMEIVEVGRCPVYYLDERPLACRAHAMMARLSGTTARAPQHTVDRDQRVMW